MAGGQGLDTFLKKGFVDNAYCGLAQQRPHIYCSRKTRQIMKTTFGGRRPSLEDDLWWRMIFGGRRPLVEDNLWWKTTLGERRPLVEDDLQWKKTFSGRQPLVEDDLGWKMTFDKKKSDQKS